MMGLDMVLECFRPKMVIFILEIGRMIHIMGMGCTFMFKGKGMREIWLKDSRKVRESTFTRMEGFMKVNGKMINERARESRGIH